MYSQGKIVFQTLFEVKYPKIHKACLDYYGVTLDQWNSYDDEFREFVKKQVVKNIKRRNKH